MSKKSLYEILDIPKDATADDIKAAYRHKAKQNHPDVGDSAEKMAEITHAYEVLGDEQRRSRYDETGNDKEDHSFVSRFSSQVDSLMIQIIMYPGFDPAKEDIIVIVKESIIDAIADFEASKKKEVQTIVTLDHVKRRIKTTGDTSIIDNLDLRITNSKQTLASIDIEIEFAMKTLEFLKQYSYEIEVEIEVIKIGPPTNLKKLGETNMA